MATILVVDDDADMRQLVQAFLLAEGYTVETAQNGKEAMRFAPDLVPDLIISDILMPSMDGFGLFEAVRKHPKTAKIPVIFLTAANERETLLRALRMGVDDFVSKPFDQSELVSVVANRLRPSAGTEAQADPWRLDQPKVTPSVAPAARREPISEYIPKPVRKLPDEAEAGDSPAAPVVAKTPAAPAPEPEAAEPQDIQADSAGTESPKAGLAKPAAPKPQAPVPPAPVAPAKPASPAKSGAASLVTIANEDEPIRFSMTDTALGDIKDATGRREATVTMLACDVRGFAKFREGLNGMQVVEILTQFFLSSRNTVSKQGGWVVKFLGDGFVAVFEDSDDHQETQQVRGLKTALMIVLAAQRLKAWLRIRFPDRKFPEFAVGIGLHTGPVSIGTLPKTAAQRNTIAGDAVALCFSLEQLTKELGWSIVASQATFLSAAEILSLGRGTMAPKVGKTENLMVAEVRGPLPDAAASQEQQKIFSLIEAAVESNTAALVAYAKAASPDESKDEGSA